MAWDFKTYKDFASDEGFRDWLEDHPGASLLNWNQGWMRLHIVGSCGHFKSETGHSVEGDRANPKAMSTYPDELNKDGSLNPQWKISRMGHSGPTHWAEQGKVVPDLQGEVEKRIPLRVNVRQTLLRERGWYPFQDGTRDGMLLPRPP